MDIHDWVIPLLILIAMLASEMPRRAAIAFCAIITVSKIPVEMFTDDASIFYIVYIPVEFLAGMALILAANHIRSTRDTFFFRLMGVMFWISAFVHYRFFWEYLGHDMEPYATISRTIGYIHVSLMMVYTDGTQRLFRDVHHLLFHRRLDEAGL